MSYTIGVGLGAGAAADGAIAQSYLELTDSRRVPVAAGPLRAEQLSAWEAAPDRETDSMRPTVLPLKFLSRKSRTSMVAPSTFDASLYKRSAQIPAYDAVRYCNAV
jgi:hypothetical protein